MSFSEKEMQELVDASEARVLDKIHELFSEIGLWDIEFDTDTIHGDGLDERGVKVTLHFTSNELVKWASPGTSDEIAKKVWERWGKKTRR